MCETMNFKPIDLHEEIIEKYTKSMRTIDEETDQSSVSSLLPKST